MADKVLSLTATHASFVRVRASHIRALWMPDQSTYLLYVDGVGDPFSLTELSAREAGQAMDELTRAEVQ